MRPLDALWNGLFYAVAAFCNAGFDLTGGFRSIRPAATDVWVNLVLIALIQLGALSYMVFADIARGTIVAVAVTRLQDRADIERRAPGGGDDRVSGSGMGRGAGRSTRRSRKLLASLFQSVSARSAGFSSIDWALVNPLTLFFWLGLMFIGGASGSTSGGVRLNTVGVVLAAMASTLRGKRRRRSGAGGSPLPSFFAP